MYVYFFLILYLLGKLITVHNDNFFYDRARKKTSFT